MRVSSLLFVALCLAAVVLAAGSETERPRKVTLKQQGPVPLHYRRPLIDTSAASSPEKTHALAKIAKIIAKEPLAARLKKQPGAGANLDLYNGEELSAESANARKSRVIAKEIRSLNSLVAQGRAILKVLPAKEKRLKALKTQMKKLNKKKVAKAAAEKLANQKQLLKDIAKQEKAMQKRLATLRNAQKKLKGSAKKLKKVAKKGKKGAKKGKKSAKKGKKAAKKGKKSAKKGKKSAKKGKKGAKKGAKKGKKGAKKGKKAAPVKKFMFRSMRSDSEVDADAEADAEAELEQEFDF